MIHSKHYYGSGLALFLAIGFTGLIWLTLGRFLVELPVLQVSHKLLGRLGLQVLGLIASGLVSIRLSELDDEAIERSFSKGGEMHGS